MKNPVTTAVVLAVLLLSGLSAEAQPGAFGSSITGTVADSTSAPLPGAVVVARNVATNETKEVITGAEGTFSIGPLVPGTYVVTVSMAGFKSAVFRDVKVVAGAAYPIKATLDIGGLSENIIVDAGWTANETLTASRTKQALKDVPVNIDAITADFVQDLGLHSADDVAPFVANVYAAPAMENDNAKGNFAFRGLAQGNNLSRNYFKWYVPTDTYNVERIDFGKGSNSLIFGDVEPGGNGAVFTKRPLPTNFGEVSAFYNSDNAYRTRIDVNRKLRKDLNVRINAISREEKTFQDASGYKFDGATVAATWQPGKNTAIRLEGEMGDYSSARGFAGIFVREQSARGLGFNTAGTYFTSDGSWILQAGLPSIDRVAANGPGGGQPSLLEGSYFDVVMRNALGQAIGTKRINGLPKSYNIRGAFDNHSRPFEAITATVNQLAGPVSLELAYSYQHQSEQRNDNSFDQTISTDVNGRPYIDSSMDRKDFSNRVNALRASAVYKLDKFSWMEQTFVATGEYRLDEQQNIRLQYFNIEPLTSGRATSINTTADRGRLRIYLDDPGFYSRALFNRVSTTGLPVTPQVNMVPLKYFASGTSAADGTEWRQNYAGSILSSGRYFNGKLMSLFGIRTDVGRTDEYVAVRKEGRFNEDIDPPRKKDALPGEYVEVEALSLTNTSLTGGVTFALTKDVNLYSVYSESFRFQANNTFDRVRIGPISGVTKEIGLKGNLFKDKGSITVGVFQIDRQNVVLSWNNVVSFNDTSTEDLMNPNNVLPGDPGYRYREPGTASASRNYTATEVSKGFDATLMFRPLNGLQVRLAAGRTDVNSVPDLSSFRRYYEEALKRPDESPALLADAKNLLDTLDVKSKAVGARAALWSASWVVDYGFSRTAWSLLRGMRMGANGSWRDDYLFGTPLGVSLTGGSTHLVNAYVMRDQKVAGRQLRVRAGVKNLTDFANGTIRKTSFTTMANGANVFRYSYVPPPQFELEVTVKF